MALVLLLCTPVLAQCPANAHVCEHNGATVLCTLALSECEQQYESCQTPTINPAVSSPEDTIKGTAGDPRPLRMRLPDSAYVDEPFDVQARNVFGPMKGVEITVSLDGSIVEEVVTEGTTALQLSAPGTYTITAKRSGYKISTQTIRVNPKPTPQEPRLALSDGHKREVNQTNTTLEPARQRTGVYVAETSVSMQPLFALLLALLLLLLLCFACWKTKRMAKTFGL